jgi:hypothetical protein
VRGTFQNPGLNASAGLVFAGTVLRVARSLIAARNQVPYFEIEFHVDRGIRGARSGQILRIREWAGLWTGGARYSPGQHVVLFLYPPSKLGFTSPVAGGMGVFSVDAFRRVRWTPQQRVLLEREGVVLGDADALPLRRFLDALPVAGRRVR